MVYSNFVPFEGFLSGDRTISFDWKAVKLIVTNQSATKDLHFKFQEGADYATLKPTEELTVEGLYQKQIFLRSLSGEVPYRVWVFG